MKKATGYISLHRQIKDWEWYRNPPTAFLFIHLLLSANYTDGVFQGTVIKRGQLVTSVPQLSTDTGLSEQQTKTALKHLRLTGEITDQANHQYRVITVVKYDQYQKLTDKNTYDQPTTNLQNHLRSTDKSANDQPQYNNINNIKNMNKEKINNTTGDSPDVVVDGFDLFWENYPKKVAKQDAIKAWKALKPDGILLGKIINGIERCKSSIQWQRENGQYIPYPASWLRGRRWEDSIEPARNNPEIVKQVMVNPKSSNNFQQRDWSNVNQQLMDDLAAEIEQAKKDGII